MSLIKLTMNQDYDLIIPIGTEYLNQVMTCLPDNCIFDKSVVGSGGTTVALTCPFNYVICVPFVSLIQNKTVQHSEIFGVYKGFSVKKLKEYLEDNSTPRKIMVTYDSLPLLLKYINPNDYKLLVDEYHLLFNSYSFRNKAIRGVLENYTKFISYCFMTATLLEREYILHELQHLPIVTARWDNIKEITVYSVECQSDVIHTVAYLTNQFLKGTQEGNAYFFVNSVEFIKNIVEACGLTDETCRAIWSQNNTKTKVGIKRSLTTDPIKKINFMTSTVFEGSDLYDKDAKIFIISDGKKAHTLVDISTSFQQIARRVRNTKYLDRVTHIYQSTRYSVNLTFDEYKAATDLEVTKAKKLANEYPTLSEDMQELIISKYKQLEKEGIFDGYLRLKDDTLYFDENMNKIDLYNFKVTKSIYKMRVNLKEEYEKEGMKVKTFTSEYNDVIAINPKKNFKETVLECQKGDSNFLLQAFEKYPFLHKAIVQFGYKGIEEMDYQITNIKRKLIASTALSETDKIKQCLKDSSYFYEGNFVTLKQIQSTFDKIYKDLSIIKSNKASEIENYFLTKSTKRKIGRGYIIIKQKL